jgi:uncharacterized protein YifE (UPF0438 family)
MGHNPSRYKLKALSADAQHVVDEYKARSVWGMWWSLDEKLRRRYFTREERAFITRYGARLDELACHRDNPRNDKEQHFLQVCVGTAEPESPRERLWLLVQLVCRYQRSVDRAARADLAEHDAFALRSENTALKAKNDHLEAYSYRLGRELENATAERPPSACNVEHATLRFHRRDGSQPIRSFVADPAFRWTPLVLPSSQSAITQP